MPKNRGLGRGLDSIFLDNSLNEEIKDKAGREAYISVIDVNPSQPRRRFDDAALGELADSIKENGLIQPIIVREKGGRFEIVAGERRFRASIKAGLEKVPVIVIEADDRKAAEYALVENVQREDLTPVEEARAYERMSEEFGMTQEEIAAKVGKSRPAVANTMRLCELDDRVLELIDEGKLSEGHGRALVSEKDAKAQYEIAVYAVENDLNVRMLEEFMKKRRNAKSKAPEKSERKEPDHRELFEERFRNLTGRGCRLGKSGGQKNIRIDYESNEELEEILKLLAGDKYTEEI